MSRLICRKILLLSLLVVSIILVIGIAVGIIYGDRLLQGKVVETWETTNKIFRVRVTSRIARDIFPVLAGAYYIFESTPSSVEDWREIMIVRHDDPVPIPREQVRFVDDRIGYVFMGWMYAVTTDGSLTWSVWNAEKDLSNWDCCNYGLIRDVTITTDGSGVMQLDPIQDRRGEVPELHTKDYGQHWSEL